MSDQDPDYDSEAREAAADFVRHLADEIVDQLVDQDEASADYNNDYNDGDSYHHESHVDKSYMLLEAAELLDQLSEYEETDSGLWEGRSPRDAISAQAAYTFGNAVSGYFTDLITQINEEWSDAVDDFNFEDGEAEVKRARLEQLEDQEELNKKEKAELVKLKNTADSFSEETREKARKDKAAEIIRDEANDFDPSFTT